MFQASYKYSAWINLGQSPRCPSQPGTVYYLHFIDEEIEALGGKFLTRGHSATQWESDLETLVWWSLSPVQRMATIVNYIIVLFKGNTPHCICSVFNLSGSPLFLDM